MYIRCLLLVCVVISIVLEMYHAILVAYLCSSLMLAGDLDLDISIVLRWHLSLYYPLRKALLFTDPSTPGFCPSCIPNAW